MSDRLHFRFLETFSLVLRRKVFTENVELSCLSPTRVGDFILNVVLNGIKRPAQWNVILQYIGSLLQHSYRLNMWDSRPCFVLFWLAQYLTMYLLFCFVETVPPSTELPTHPTLNFNTDTSESSKFDSDHSFVPLLAQRVHLITSTSCFGKISTPPHSLVMYTFSNSNSIHACYFCKKHSMAVVHV